MGKHTKIILPCPKAGETFILSINGDDGRNHPDALVRRAGDTRKLKHDGPLVMMRTTRNFKPIETTDSLPFDGVVDELARHGRIPCSQWLISFMAVYRSNGGRLIGIADASWEAPDHKRHFPYIDLGGNLRFHATDGIFGKVWLWIVAVSR